MSTKEASNPTSTLTARLLKSFASIAVWQKSISDHKYGAPPKGTDLNERFDSHKDLVKTALESSESYLEVVKRQLGAEFSAEILNQVPSLPLRVTPHECAHPNYETDKAIHRAFVEQDCRRELASKWAFWHLVTLRAIRDRKFSDPPYLLLHNNYTGELPVNRGVLALDNNSATAKDRKALDNTIRNLLRHSGGIYHRKRSYLFDAALPAAWWRVEISSAAAKTNCGLDEATIYKALRDSWRNWATKAAWSTTRLAAPNTAAAFAIAVNNHKAETGSATKGKSTDEIIKKFMRRTMHLSVTHVSPQDLAELIA